MTAADWWIKLVQGHVTFLFEPQSRASAGVWCPRRLVSLSLPFSTTLILVPVAEQVPVISGRFAGGLCHLCGRVVETYNP